MKSVTFIILLGLLGHAACSAQGYRLKNETILFSFKTGNQKMLTICKDRNNRYLVYRFGAPGKIELAYPVNPGDSSWRTFEYTYLLRGGGAANAGIDLNNLTFTENGFRYTVYQNYYAEGGEYRIGVKVINMASGKAFDIKGIKSSQTGSLAAFRDLPKIKQGEELFAE